MGVGRGVVWRGQRADVATPLPQPTRTLHPSQTIRRLAQPAYFNPGPQQPRVGVVGRVVAARHPSAAAGATPPPATGTPVGARLGLPIDHRTSLRATVRDLQARLARAAADMRSLIDEAACEREARRVLADRLAEVEAEGRLVDGKPASAVAAEHAARGAAGPRQTLAGQPRHARPVVLAV